MKNSCSIIVIVSFASWLASKVFESRLTGDDPQTISEPIARQLLTDSPRTISDSSAYERAVSWAERDLNGLSEWLNKQPNSRAVDLGVRAYCERLMCLSSPNVAAASAISIKDDKIRAQTIIGIVDQWYKEDPDKASAWASEIGIPTQELEGQNRLTRLTRRGAMSEESVKSSPWYSGRFDRILSQIATETSSTAQ